MSTVNIELFVSGLFYCIYSLYKKLYFSLSIFNYYYPHNYLNWIVTIFGEQNTSEFMRVSKISLRGRGESVKIIIGNKIYTLGKNYW